MEDCSFSRKGPNKDARHDAVFALSAAADLCLMRSIAGGVRTSWMPGGRNGIDSSLCWNLVLCLEEAISFVYLLY
jgi:hypothetical protein